VRAALDDALTLLDESSVLYEALPNSSRRLVNQAIFLALTVRNPDDITATRTLLFDAVRDLADQLGEAKQAPQDARKRPRTAEARARCRQNDHDPDFRGRGSYIEQMAERAGFEPAMEFNPHTRLAGECLQPLGHLSLGSASIGLPV
jgi:hypothetical protein